MYWQVAGVTFKVATVMREPLELMVSLAQNIFFSAITYARTKYFMTHCFFFFGDYICGEQNTS